MINVGVIGFAHGHVMSYGQNWLDHPELGVKITAGLIEEDLVVGVQTDFHVVELEYGDHGKEVIPCFGDVKTKVRQNVGTDEHHVEALRFGQTVVVHLLVRQRECKGIAFPLPSIGSHNSISSSALAYT